MRNWLSKPLVRGIGVALVVVIAAMALKAWRDSMKIDEGAERAAVDEWLMAQHKALGDQLDEGQGAEALPEQLPWLPPRLACAGGTVPRDQPIPEAWHAVLGAPEAEGGGTGELPRRFQVGFRRRGEQVVWMARRDIDCDGIFEIHTLEASLGWEGTLRHTRVQVQHLGE